MDLAMGLEKEMDLAMEKDLVRGLEKVMDWVKEKD